MKSKIKISQTSIWPADRTLICTTNPGLGGTESNGNKKKWDCIPQWFRTQAPLSNAV